ncbi:amino acid adenylation domain-containing protein [Streptomyces jumonjinensis]|uniref:amino acid adenylation domain-containing protein n=1 Tax=Streptomyces jumonjinensis TaxID=1945 RepID=UPI0037A91295
MTVLTGALVVRPSAPLGTAAVDRALASVALPPPRTVGAWAERLPYASTDPRAAALRCRTAGRPFARDAGALLRVALLDYADGVQDVVIAAPASLLDETGLHGVALRLAADAPPVALKPPGDGDSRHRTPPAPVWGGPGPGGPERYATARVPLPSLTGDAAASALAALGGALAHREPGHGAVVSVRCPGVADSSLGAVDRVFDLRFPAGAAFDPESALHLARTALSAAPDGLGLADIAPPAAEATDSWERAPDPAAGVAADESVPASAPRTDAANPRRGAGGGGRGHRAPARAGRSGEAGPRASGGPLAELVLPVPRAGDDLLRTAGFARLSRPYGSAHAPLVLVLDHGASGPTLSCAYRADLFAREAVTALLDEIAEFPDRPQPAAQEQPTAPHTTIHALVEEQAALRPHAVAVTCGGENTSYGRLDDWAHGIAAALIAKGTGPGHLVGVSLPRGPELVATLLGVLKSGAAYVPMDPASPQERLRYLVEDSQVSLLVTRDTALAPADCPTLVPPAPPGTRTARAPTTPTARPDDPAYVIYTSGSTGRPKGVVVEHRGFAALLTATRSEFGLVPDDVWTFFHSYAFDFSVWEIWGCLATGGRLVVVPHEAARAPQEFRSLLHREGVTVLSQTPSAFTQLLSTEGPDAAQLAVRLLILGGEPLDARILLTWFDAHPERECRAVNLYGITETTVHCTWHTLARRDALAGTRSVGRPLPGWSLHILDGRGRPLPAGVPGEIHVGGVGLARGYHRRPGLTAQRFRPNDQETAAGTRLYRSGDRGRMLHDGTVEHLGRLDGQVKVRGYRIELGEIRGRLLEIPEVRAAAVVMNRRGEAHDAHLDAYVAGADPRPAALRARLAQVLPDYMLPSTITVLDDLPLTGNGKLDPSGLPTPVPAPERAGTRTAETADPDGETLQSRISRIWRDVLGAPVAPDDNFFLVGGNSLLAIRVMARMREGGLTDGAVRLIYRHPTVRRLAEALTGI